MAEDKYEAAIRFLEKLAGQWRADANRVELDGFLNYAAIHREAVAEAESALAIVREAREREGRIESLLMMSSPCSARRPRMAADRKILIIAAVLSLVVAVGTAITSDIGWLRGVAGLSMLSSTGVAIVGWTGVREDV